MSQCSPSLAWPCQLAPPICLIWFIGVASPLRVFLEDKYDLSNSQASVINRWAFHSRPFRHLPFPPSLTCLPFLPAWSISSQQLPHLSLVFLWIKLDATSSGVSFPPSLPPFLPCSISLPLFVHVSSPAPSESWYRGNLGGPRHSGILGLQPHLPILCNDTDGSSLLHPGLCALAARSLHCSRGQSCNSIWHVRVHVVAQVGH